MSKNQNDVVALITAPRIASRWLDIETPLVEHALKDLNVQTEVVAWYEENDWSQYSLIVIRSPWDFYWHTNEFVAWVENMRGLPLLNGPDVLLWNLNKHYLDELKAAGIPTVETIYAKPGSSITFPSKEFVVKPVISEGAINTARYRVDETAIAKDHVETLHAKGTEVMIQPYLANVDVSGERSLVFFNESFDHAIQKQAVLKPGEAYHVEHESHPDPVLYTPTPAELELASAAIAAVPHNEKMLYARVDLAIDDNNNPIVMELELLDPVLFLHPSENSAHRYATAIASYL